jgi:hypothetical protein
MMILYKIKFTAPVFSERDSIVAACAEWYQQQQLAK